jgi:6-pyruvoyltetrahydropterin/6-carboxytetrahydropterin synthase
MGQVRFEIAKKFRFEACHWLHNLPREHKCSRVHGHSYTVELGLSSGDLDYTGFVRDYGDLREFRDLIERLDHRTLLAMGQNAYGIPTLDIIRLPVVNTSAEEIARYLLQEAHNFYGAIVDYVEVRETETSYARARAPIER